MKRTTGVYLMVALIAGVAMPSAAWAEACHCVLAKTWESTSSSYTADAADAEKDKNLSFTAAVGDLPDGTTVDDVTWQWKHDGTVISTSRSMQYAFDQNYLGPQTVTVTATVEGESVSDSCTVNVVERVIIDTLTSRPDAKVSFNDANEVKGHVMPTTVSHLDGSLDWDCSGPPSEHCGLWDDANGDLEYVETFGGSAVWPTSNASWGSDSLILTLDKRVKSVTGGDDIDERDDLDTAGGLQSSITVSLFYDADGTQNSATNNPPNWFAYYRDNEGSGGAYTYDGTLQTSQSSPGGGTSSIRIADSAYSGGEYITHDYSNGGNTLKALGWSDEFEYYTYFLGVIAHETQHATNETTGNENPNDNDGKDYLPATFETNTSLTDSSQRFSARGYPDGPQGLTGTTWDDGECYAGGPVEKGGIDNADTSNDWAHPGTNWTP